MLKELALTALVALTPAEKKALDNFQTRLKENGYDISQYINDPRFGIYRFEKKVKKLINYADTTQSWYMRPDSIEKCADFIEENYYWLKKIQDEHGPSPEYMTSLLQLETRCGEYTGEFPVIVAFASVYIDRPDRRNEYYRHMIDFLDLFADTTDNIVFPKDIFDVKVSWAGAYGIPQGMPYQIKKHGPIADGDGDGVCDLMKMPDAIKFTGLLLDKEFGFNENQSHAVKKYNHGHKFYGPAIVEHTDALVKIMEKRNRIPPPKINSILTNLLSYPKPEKSGKYQYMKQSVILSKKQPFIRRIIPNRKKIH